jgi:hypothetical protein
VGGKAGDLPTRAVEPRDDADGDGVGHARKDDRDRTRLPLDGDGRRGRACQDDVGLRGSSGQVFHRNRFHSQGKRSFGKVIAVFWDAWAKQPLPRWSVPEGQPRVTIGGGLAGALVDCRCSCDGSYLSVAIRASTDKRKSAHSPRVRTGPPLRAAQGSPALPALQG